MTGGSEKQVEGEGEGERGLLENGRKIDQAAWEDERRETVDEQQPRAVLLFSETRGWLRFVGVVATDSRPANQPVNTFDSHTFFSNARKKATSIKAFSIRTIRPRSLIYDFYFV